MTFVEFDRLKQQLIHLEVALHAEGRHEEGELCLREIMLLEQSYLSDSYVQTRKDCEDLLSKHSSFLERYDSENL